MVGLVGKELPALWVYLCATRTRGADQEESAFHPHLWGLERAGPPCLCLWRCHSEKGQSRAHLAVVPARALGAGPVTQANER